MAARADASFARGTQASTSKISTDVSDEGWQVVTRKRVKKEKVAKDETTTKVARDRMPKSFHHHRTHAGDKRHMPAKAREDFSRSTQRNLRDFDSSSGVRSKAKNNDRRDEGLLALDSAEEFPLLPSLPHNVVPITPSLIQDPHPDIPDLPALLLEETRMCPRETCDIVLAHINAVRAHMDWEPLVRSMLASY